MKSQAWYDLQGTGGNTFLTIINNAFVVLKAYASSHTVPVNEIFEIPVTDDDLIAVAKLPDAYRGIFTASARFKITGETGSAFQIYCDFSLSGSQGSASLLCTAKTRFDITTEGSDSKMDMYFLIGTEQSDGVNTMSNEIPVYASYDSKTGACSMVAKQDSGGSTLVSIQETKVDAVDGSISNINTNIANGIPSYLHVAYGNDTAGGIASVSPFSYDSNGDGTPEDHDSYWGEYYNSNGELICRTNGDNNIYAPVGDITRYTNLQDLGYTTPPEIYSIRYHSTYEDDQYFWYNERKTSTGWEVFTRKYYTSDGESQTYTTTIQEKSGEVWVDVYRASWDGTGGEQSEVYWDGSSWQPGAGPYRNYDSWDFMFKATPGVWSTGDAIYYYKEGISYTESEITYNQTNFYKGYVVPAPDTKLGKSFYISYEYPLRNVLPLAGSYATDYKLIQEEGTTYSDSWTDWEGNHQTWSWTNYSYYLNKNSRDLDGDGVIDPESPIRFDENFDIKLDKLSQYDIYYWHNGEIEKTKGYFVRISSQDALPDYLSTPDTTVINMVDGKLQTLLDSAYFNSATAYDAQIETAGNAAAGVF